MGLNWILPKKKKYVFETWYSKEIPKIYKAIDEEYYYYDKGYEYNNHERKLDWFFASKDEYEKFDDDTWYENYDRNEVPKNPNSGGDDVDRIRSSDVCYR